MSLGQGAMPPPLRYLCICADDFGLHPGINAAVLALAESGRISAASCMVRRPAWAEGAAQLRRMARSRIDVGLHLDFTRPVREGEAEPGLGRLIARSYTGLLPAESVRREIGEQLQRFEDALGRAPDFVDGHRHVHQLPVVREMLIEALRTRYGSALPWIRGTAPREPRSMLSGLRKADLIFSLGGKRMAALALRHGIPASRALLGVYGFDGDAAAYRERLLRWLANARTGDVLMCHPGLGRTAADSVDPIAAARRNEYAVLRAMNFPVQTTGGAVALAPLSQQMAPIGLP